MNLLHPLKSFCELSNNVVIGGAKKSNAQTKLISVWNLQAVNALFSKNV